MLILYVFVISEADLSGLNAVLICEERISPLQKSTVLYVSQAMKKCVLCHMGTTKAQISLRIRAVWSAPLLFAAKIVRYNISRFYSQNFKTLASFCGCAGRFLSNLVANSRRHVLSCRGTCVKHNVGTQCEDLCTVKQGCFLQTIIRRWLCCCSIFVWFCGDIPQDGIT